MFKKISLLLFVTIFSTNVLAVIDTNKMVNIVGVSATNKAHFSVDGNFSVACKYNVVYVPISSEFGKTAYSTLLTAKATKTKLYRISYTIDSTTEICTLGLIEIK